MVITAAIILVQMSPKCVKRERDEGTKVKKDVAIGENIITG